MPETARVSAKTAATGARASKAAGDAPRPSRTQAERRAATTERLLDATVECLIELGYSGTTTPIVCDRAGLSRGALLHHYPTKAELVIAAVAHLARRTGDRVRNMPAPPKNKRDRLDRLLEVIWDSFSGPLFYAALELWVACRTDSELHKHVYELERALGRAIRQVSEGLVAADPDKRAAYADQIELTLYMLRGMALQKILRRDDAHRRRLFELWKRMVTRALQE